MVIASVILGTAPFVAVGVLAMVVSWRRYHRFEGCCPPPDRGRVWACGHRTTWLRYGRHEWKRIGTRRYIRLAMEDLDREIVRASRGGRKH